MPPDIDGLGLGGDVGGASTSELGCGSHLILIGLLALLLIGLIKWLG